MSQEQKKKNQGPKIEIESSALDQILLCLDQCSRGDFKQIKVDSEDPNILKLVEKINQATTTANNFKVEKLKEQNTHQNSGDVTESITAQKIAQEDLEKTKTHLAGVIELVPAGIFENDLDGNNVFSNSTWYKMTGLSPSESLGFGWMQAVHPDDREKVGAEWAASVREKRDFELIYRLVHKNGKVITVKCRCCAILNLKNEVTGYFGTVQDISDQQDTLERLYQTSRELDQFFEMAGGLLAIADVDGRLVKVNPAFASSLGMKAAELIGQVVIDFAHTNDYLTTKSEFDRLKKYSYLVHFENRSRCKDGSYKALSWTASRDPETGMIYLAGRDITEERRRDHDLNQIWEALNKSAIVAITDKGGKIVDVNENFSKISGFRRDELLGKNHRMVKSDKHTREFFRQLWGTITSGKAWSGEIQNRAKDGSSYFVQTVITPLFGIDGNIDRFLAIRFDVTKQRESERQLEEAQRVAKIGSWSFDLRKKEILWSKQMYELFPEKIENGPPSFEKHYATIHPDDQAHWSETVGQCAKDGRAYKMRFRSVFPDREVWIEAYGEGFKDRSGEIIALSGTCQDITGLVEAEDLAKLERAKALHSAKLASLGEMSAGIAHEINNPLAIISGTARLLPRFLQDPEKFKTKIEAIEKAAARISKIVTGLRKFSRSSEKSEQKLIPAEVIVKEALILTDAKAVRNDVHVTSDFQTSEAVLCNEIEIEQVLVNLLNNAIDAAAGTAEKWVKVRMFEEKNHVVIQVRDSGSGIPEDVQRKLFQPFFTTKKVGEGTGLGLSITKGILDEHRASIEVLTRDPNTCFEIRFPKVEVAKNVA